MFTYLIIHRLFSQARRSDGDPHPILGQEHLAFECLPAVTNNIGLIAGGIEMGEAEPLAAGLLGNAAGQRWGEMACDLLSLGEGAF
jgi:hypothetical protein